MKKLISYLTVAAIVFDLFTPLRLYFAGGKALSMLIPTLLIVVYDGLYLKKSFIPLALYIGGAMVTMLMGNTYFTIPFFLSVVFAYVCFEHYMVTRDMNFAKTVVIALYGTLFVMVSTSLPLFISMPNLSRIMLNAEENGVTSPLFYWTLSYQAIHSLPIYSIPVFYLYKNSKKKYIRIVSLIFFAAIFVLLLFADSTGALFVNVAVLGILLLYDQKKSLKANIYRLIVLGCSMMVFLNKSVLVALLTIVQPIFSGSSNFTKIDEIKYMLQGGETEGDIEGREEKLDMSWKSFVGNPLFPTIEKSAYDKIGGHNFLFDQIVALGLLLGIFFIWFLIERIRRPLKYLTKTARPYYLVGVLAMLVMGAMKNYFLLMPSCCILPMILITAENPMMLKIKR